jgi:hypothetical protein
MNAFAQTRICAHEWNKNRKKIFCFTLLKIALKENKFFFQLLLYVFRAYFFNKILNVDREVRRVLVERNTALSFRTGPW